MKLYKVTYKFLFHTEERYWSGQSKESLLRWINETYPSYRDIDISPALSIIKTEGNVTWVDFTGFSKLKEKAS